MMTVVYTTEGMTEDSVNAKNFTARKNFSTSMRFFNGGTRQAGRCNTKLASFEISERFKFIVEYTQFTQDR